MNLLFPFLKYIFGNLEWCLANSLQDSTANEGLVRIQYKCLVPIYVLPEMKLLFPKQNYNVLSPSYYIHISVRDLYIPGLICLFCCREICGLILGIYKSLTDIPRKGIHKWDFLCSEDHVIESQFDRRIFSIFSQLWKVTFFFYLITQLLHREAMHRGSQVDVVYLGWPIAPS
jgi:hypothetical protein